MPDLFYLDALAYSPAISIRSLHQYSIFCF